VTVADTLFSSVKVLAALMWLKQIDLVGGHWLVQHTAPVRATLDGRPSLEKVRYKYPTICLLLFNPAFPAPHAHIAHTYRFQSSPWASARDRSAVSAL